MQRDLDALGLRFDVLVIGAGVYGACIARLAALAGLKVALLERDDFGGATSRNSAKLVHGGLRYVQHFDLPRIRESAEAQRLWRLAAPHLVRPLRFTIPTYGAGTRGPAALAAGILLYETATWRRNRGVEASLRLPRAGVLGRRRLLEHLPMIDPQGVTGGAYWYDAQMLDASRLTFECIADACRAGAVVANHVEARALLVSARGVEGVSAVDRIAGRELEVRARITVNATGPWMDRLLLTGPLKLRKRPPLPLARNVNLVTRRILELDEGIGVASRRPSDAAIGRSRRLFFVTPWQDCSIIGTWHDPFPEDPDAVALTEAELEGFLTEVSDALPAVRLTLDDVRSVHLGLTPAGEDETGRARRPSVVDHEKSDGLPGLLSIAGVKYTTAPTTAARALAPICRRLRFRPERPVRFERPLPGARAPASAAGADDPAASTGEPASMPAYDDPAVRWVTRIYGAESERLLAAVPPAGLTPSEHVFRCRVLHGVRHEMVFTLSDALCRATDHAERGALTAAQLEWCADVLASTLKWSAARRGAELDEMRARLARGAGGRPRAPHPPDWERTLEGRRA